LYPDRLVAVADVPFELIGTSDATHRVREVGARREIRAG
jgi:hypothetical protein